MFVYSVALRKSFDDIDAWYREFCHAAIDAQNVSVLLLGNKADLADIVTKRMAQRMVPDSILVSAKTGAGLKELGDACRDLIADEFGGGGDFLCPEGALVFFGLEIDAA